VSDPVAFIRNKIMAVALLLALCSGLYFWRLGNLPFHTRGEPREALVVWEMVRTGNWILPLINDDYIPYKPPLFHWFGVLTSEIYGDVNELTVRLPSALFATLGVFLIYLAAGRFWNAKAGLVAALVLATRPEWWNSATETQVDMTLAFFITAALVLFYRMYKEEHYGVGWSSALAALVALATLAKGPIGCAVPTLAIIVFLGASRDFAFLKKVHFLSAIFVFIVIAGSWYAGALWQGGWAFFKRQILEENLGTAEGTFGHHQSYGYFFPIFLLNLAPWSLFLPAIGYFVYSRRRTLSADHLLFPIIWLVTVFAFCTLSSGKRGVYILPLYPAAALLIGAWWSNVEKGDVHARWLTSATTVLMAVLTLFSIGLFVVTVRGDGQSIIPLPKKLGVVTELLQSSLPLARAVVWTSLGLMGAGAALILGSALRKNCNGLLVALTLIATTVIIFLKLALYPAVAAKHTLKPFVNRLPQNVAPQTPLLFYRSFDYGTVFYSRRHIPNYADRVNELRGPFYLLMWEEDWRRLSKANHLKMLDISEGGGPTGRHRLVLVESVADPASPKKNLPLIDPQGYSGINTRPTESASD
jgi:4-amino-4-deoxy-L-arabinose transferase-like glycosyltransferase